MGYFDKKDKILNDMSEIDHILNLARDENIKLTINDLGRSQAYQRINFDYFKSEISYSDYEKLMHNIISRIESTDYFRGSDTLYNGIYRISFNIPQISMWKEVADKFASLSESIELKHLKSFNESVEDHISEDDANYFELESYGEEGREIYKKYTEVLLAMNHGRVNHETIGLPFREYGWSISSAAIKLSLKELVNSKINEDIKRFDERERISSNIDEINQILNILRDENIPLTIKSDKTVNRLGTVYYHDIGVSRMKSPSWEMTPTFMNYRPIMEIDEFNKLMYTIFSRLQEIGNLSIYAHSYNNKSLMEFKNGYLKTQWRLDGDIREYEIRLYC